MTIIDPDYLPAGWRMFPATTTRAFYDSFAQYIQLSDVSAKDLIIAFQRMKDEPTKSFGPLPVFFHELRHWIDHVSTLWGQQRLVASFNAINARRHNRPEEFWRISEYMRLVNRDSVGKYYQTIEQAQVPQGANSRWVFQFTSGMTFDSNGRLDNQAPIFFTKFAWSDGTVACRVPFSVNALLETSAMHTEIEIENYLVEGFSNVERRIEEGQISKRRIAEAYNAELAVYSTAVHSVANRMDLTNLNDAYTLASILASFCLNLPSTLFDSLTVPEEFQRIWASRNQVALANRNRGYAYLLILFHADKALVDDPDAWIESAAAKAGLPPLIEIVARAKTERDALVKDAIDGPYRDRLQQLLSNGDAIYQKFGLSYTVESVMKFLPEIVFPPILCSDLVWVPLGASQPIDPVEVEAWCWECSELEKQFEEFVAACGQ